MAAGGFVYHLVPPKIFGEVLIPLNVLKLRNHELYSAAIKKYEGREFLMDEIICPLNCLWNDVLHFSTIDPCLIFAELDRLGLMQTQEWKVFKVSASLLDVRETTIYSPFYPEEGAFKVRPEDFCPFEPSKYQEMRELNSASKRYFKEVKEQAGRALLFKYIPHVLFRGELNIQGLEMVVWKKS